MNVEELGLSFEFEAQSGVRISSLHSRGTYSDRDFENLNEMGRDSDQKYDESTHPT